MSVSNVGSPVDQSDPARPVKDGRDGNAFATTIDIPDISALVIASNWLLDTVLTEPFIWALMALTRSLSRWIVPSSLVIISSAVKVLLLSSEAFAYMREWLGGSTWFHWLLLDHLRQSQ